MTLENLVSHFRKISKSSRTIKSSFDEEAAGLEGVKDLVLSPDQLEKSYPRINKTKKYTKRDPNTRSLQPQQKEGDKVNRLIQKNLIK